MTARPNTLTMPIGREAAMNRERRSSGVLLSMGAG